MALQKLTEIHRRCFLELSASAAAVPSLPRTGWAVGSETHSSMIGDVELTVLSDGSLTLPSGALAPAAPREEFEALLTRTMGSLPETVEAGTNHALLRVGDDLVLIDNGSGNKYQPTAGKLLDNLAHNGVDPASVTKVVFTHAHPDHIWGTLLGATMVGTLQKGIEWFNPSNTLAAQTYMILFIILFIQFRPRGIIALKGRAAEA